MLKISLLYSLILMTFISMGCGTDVKPNYFIGMFRDEGDINRLSTCLTEVPSVDGDTITIKADSPCLVQLSNTDTSDPNADVSFTEILNDPESYLDKIVTFEAIIKKVDQARGVGLYTNRQGIQFYIYSHGANIYFLDKDGEEVDVVPNEKYKLKVRIYKIEINENGIWHVYADFIVSSNKKIVHPPVLAT